MDLGPTEMTEVGERERAMTVTIAGHKLLSADTKNRLEWVTDTVYNTNG